MKLPEFFATIAPCLHDPRATAAVAAALYPESPEGTDARRLSIYAGHCASARRTLVTFVYPTLARVVTAERGEEGWQHLGEQYFAKHPMQSWTLHENVQQFPEFLLDPTLGIPPWQAELADLEWWSWITRIAPDAPEDADDEGPLRLAATAEVRPYNHAVLSFWEEEDEEEELPATPAATPQWVLFFRDRRLRSRVQLAEPLTLALLKIIQEKLEVDAVAPLLGCSPLSLHVHAANLHREGLLRGSLDADGGARPSDQ
ncbi:MAG TPA: putative DNA-binding domain-containing protein [Myxococcota bacterium]|nr:putative DNA-binding domain-containing protein [Myxococcota bacterium]